MGVITVPEVVSRHDGRLRVRCACNRTYVRAPVRALAHIVCAFVVVSVRSACACACVGACSCAYVSVGGPVRG